MRTRHTLIALLSLTTLSACSTPAPQATGKYQQTWTTPYSDTTCADYLDKMTYKQRWIMAADLLASVRKGDGGTTVPDDSDVSRFEGDVATTCRPKPTKKPAGIAAVLYKADSTYQP